MASVCLNSSDRPGLPPTKAQTSPRVGVASGGGQGGEWLSSGR